MKQLKRNSKSERPIKVIQFGGGNFLRGYADWMIDVLNEQTDFNGDVTIVKPTERGDYHALRSQDGLFHILTKGMMNGKVVDEIKQIKCVQEIIHPYIEWNKFLASAENPNIEIIISNTTESGIAFNTKDLYVDDPPPEFPAKLCRWLHHRWQYFDGDPSKACLVLPCELIVDNGLTLRKCITQYAELWGLQQSFLQWIIKHNIFCNTLVDRIVSGYPQSSSLEIEEKLGLKDLLLTESEPYHLLAIESPIDITHILPFDKTDLNVKFTDNLDEYRTIKVRLLNGAHTSMVPVGYLAGKETVREAIGEDSINIWLKALLYEEVLPTLDFPKELLESYIEEVLERFHNPFLNHKLIDISLNSISKFKTRLLPSLLSYIHMYDKPPKRILKALASLLIMYRGKRGEETIPLRDSQEVLSFMESAWTQWSATKDTQSLVQSILSNNSFWEQDLTAISGLAEGLVEALEIGVKQHMILE